MADDDDDDAGAEADEAEADETEAEVTGTAHVVRWHSSSVTRAKIELVADHAAIEEADEDDDEEDAESTAFLASHTRTARNPISGRPPASAPRAVTSATAFSSIDDDDDDEDADAVPALDDGHSARAAKRIAPNARPAPPPLANAPSVAGKSERRFFHSHTLVPSVSPARVLPLAPSANAASINDEAEEPLPFERAAAAADFCCLTSSACCSAGRFLRM